MSLDQLGNGFHLASTDQTELKCLLERASFWAAFVLSGYGYIPAIDKDTEKQEHHHFQVDFVLES
jgi:hypothetical protein